MPWHKVENHSACPAGRRWAVVKDDDGEVEGCHATEARADKQLAALYAQEGGAERMSDEEIINTPLYRQTPPADLIFRDEDDPIIEGMVVPFNQWTEVDSVIEGHFMERFAPGSLTKTFNERLNRLRGFFDHGLSRLFDTMPVMDIREAWEQPDGAFFRAGLLPSVPDLIKDGLRRGIYGVSLGAKVVNMQRIRRPGKSAHNPAGIEERTYTELRAKDISLTATPHYKTNLVFRSITDELLISDELVIERLLADPRRFMEKLVSRSEESEEAEQEDEKEETEPQHSGREEPEPETVEEKAVDEGEPDPQRSRSTQPSRDYLRDEEGEPSWRL